LPERIEDALKYNIDIAVSNLETLQTYVSGNFSTPLNIHIKVDTGLHRIGFLPHDIGTVVETLKHAGDKIKIKGLFTHFAQAKDPTDKTYTERQIGEFKTWINAFHEAGFKPLIHAAATASMFLYPETQFDMVRVGAGLYGILPSKKFTETWKEVGPFQAALSWKTIVVETKIIGAGEGIGYELTEKVSRDTNIAICPIGYWHGYVRSLSSRGKVIIRGKPANILGVISMDMICVDCTDIPGVHSGDVVTLVDTNEESPASASNLADLAGTTVHEFITRLNSRIERIYLP
jgi:alanine racemase